MICLIETGKLELFKTSIERLEGSIALLISLLILTFLARGSTEQEHYLAWLPCLLNEIFASLKHIRCATPMLQAQLQII